MICTLKLLLVHIPIFIRVKGVQFDNLTALRFGVQEIEFVLQVRKYIDPARFTKQTLSFKRLDSEKEYNENPFAAHLKRGNLLRVITV